MAVPSYFNASKSRAPAKPAAPKRNDFLQPAFRAGTRQYNERVRTQRAAARRPAPPKVYSSDIPTSTGITGSQARSATAIPQVYRGGGDAGSSSRDAYARAMAQVGANQQANTLDQYRQAYQQQGEQARSRDIMNQRQQDLARYGYDVESKRTIRQQGQQHERNLEEIRNFRRNAAKGFQTQLATGALGAVFGGNLLTNLLVPAGEAYAGGARPFGGGGLFGAFADRQRSLGRPLFGGLLGR